jgi:cystathionine beta-lyase
MSHNFDEIIDRRNTNSIKWTAYDPDILPMWVADMDFRSPEPIRQALAKAVEHGIFGYEFAIGTLRELVASRMKQLYGWDVAVESILPVTGLVSGFFAAASALCQPGDGYVIQPPVYMPFNDIQKRLGVIRQEAQLVKTTRDRIVRYEIDWDVFDAAFNAGGSATRMFLLCNPHNPTGGIYTAAELTRMAETCARHNAVVVSDEIHSELLLDGNKHTTLAALDPEIARRTITLIAPSKTFNIAGLFCGLAIIPDPELRERYKNAVERMTLHVSSLAYVAAEAAFSGACDEWLVDLRKYLTANRDFMVDYVQKNLPGINITVPDATYLAWLDCSGLNLPGGAYDFFLKQAKVALNQGETFGLGGEGFVRLNFGTPRATLLEGLERMKKALETV